LVEQVVQYTSDCELQGSDVEKAEVTFVTLEGLGEKKLVDHKVISGVTTEAGQAQDSKQFKTGVRYGSTSSR
jgi:hypothetical protein